jgi:hypothetical protein
LIALPCDEEPPLGVGALAVPEVLGPPQPASSAAAEPATARELTMRRNAMLDRTCAGLVPNPGGRCRDRFQLWRGRGRGPS